MNNYINQSVHNDKVEQLSKQLQQEKLLKQQAVNKLAEIMNRRDMNLSGKKSKGSSADLRRKEKECRKLQQDLTTVCHCMCLIGHCLRQSSTGTR